MKKEATTLIILMISLAFANNIKAQYNYFKNQSLQSGDIGAIGDISKTFDENNAEISTSAHNKARFFITPFYQFTQFKELKLASHSNRYKLYEGNNFYQYPQSDIDEYNNNYGTEYQNNMYGIKIGYQAYEGFGVSGYIGLDKYTFKSWVSHDGNHYNSTKKPAITYGVALDYYNAIYDKLLGMAMITYNYAKSNEGTLTNSSGNPNSSIKFTSGYWEINLVLGYPFGNLLPYAGAGYTELYVNSDHEEVISNTDKGTLFYDRVEFDSKFEGHSFYVFAGGQYKISDNLSMYARSSFLNPLRANLGIKILF